MTDRLTRLLEAGEPCPQPDTHGGWWLLPAMIAGAGLWAALAWWCPVAAGLLLVACGVAVMVGA